MKFIFLENSDYLRNILLTRRWRLTDYLVWIKYKFLQRFLNWLFRVCELCVGRVGKPFCAFRIYIHTLKAGFNVYGRAHTKRATVANDNEQRSAYGLCRHDSHERDSCQILQFFLFFSFFPLVHGNAITRPNCSRMHPAYCR